MAWVEMNRAKRIDRIAVSKIQQLAQTEREMRAAGQSVVDLSASLPDYDTPVYIRDDAMAAIDRGKTPGGQTLDTDTALSDYLLETTRAVTALGSEFGLAGHLRLSFAVSEANIALTNTAVGRAIASLTSE